MKVYVLQHEHDLGDDAADVKLIGIYASEADARAAQGRMSKAPGFVAHRDGFSIDVYELGRDHWTEGFRSVRSDGGREQTATEAA